MNVYFFKFVRFRPQSSKTNNNFIKIRHLILFITQTTPKYINQKFSRYATPYSHGFISTKFFIPVNYRSNMRNYIIRLEYLIITSFRFKYFHRNTIYTQNQVLISQEIQNKLLLNDMNRLKWLILAVETCEMTFSKPVDFRESTLDTLILTWHFTNQKVF